MTSIDSNLKQQVVSKKETLDKVKAQLKREFIGIDSVIDNLIESFGYWYYFPDMLKRPVIVNLWGLTGVGKTSLVQRLVQLTGLNEQFYRFNMCDDDYEIKENIRDIYHKIENPHFILLFDEFQHFRTINEDGKEKSGKYQYLWDLFDTGHMPVMDFSHRIGSVHDLVVKLRKLLQMGVEVKNGVVISNLELFGHEMNIDIEHEKTDFNNRHRNRRLIEMAKKGKSPKELNHNLDNQNIVKIPFNSFVPQYFFEYIVEIAPQRFTLESEVFQLLQTMDGWKILTFLTNLMRKAMSMQHIDCSKALVFIIGNLDEAYKMSDDYDTDISADEFHEQSLKIKLPRIKRALQTRFRNEQIARLGNNHIIYPALNKTSFLKIIDLELLKIDKEMQETMNICLEFTDPLKQLLYNEGVFPTQGTRPLFSTIYQLVNSQIPKIFYHVVNASTPIDKVLMHYESDFLSFMFFIKDQIQFEVKEKLELKLEDIRKTRRDDLQAITAVHECGHAVLSAILMRVIPENIYSITSDTNAQGFVYTKMKWEYIAKNEIVRRIALMLGGIVAEKLVFGEENITTGSKSDIKKATHFASDMVKASGLGSTRSSIHVKNFETVHYIHDTDDRYNNEVKSLMTQAEALAEKTLNEQRNLLLRMSEYLSDHRSMDKLQITDYVSKYAQDFNPDCIIENGEQLFYRKFLKNQLEELNRPKSQFMPLNESTVISLNSNTIQS